MKLPVIGLRLRLINKHMVRGVENGKEKRNGTFGSIILLSVLALTLFILNGESFLECINDGFTDDVSIKVQD
ncbi:hypothetical protein KYJ26_06920 [Bacillus sp. MCCB 382]|uniref:hypothetical protein n=1 Tax=Bacillus sp. MCCB 382 TaxID=2860197 RepID=UPI001C56E837|nr:hypothetical protein [Bacillus sp. MCCB 382]